MRRFSIPEHTIKKLIRQEALITGIYYIVLLSGIFLSTFLFGKASSLARSFLTVIIFFIWFVYWFIRHVKERTDYYKSYEITIDGRHITEYYLHTERASFTVENVVKTDKGGFYVSGSGIQIYIHPFIGDRENLENSLPIINKESFYKERNRFLKILIRHPLLSLATLMACFLIGNKAIMIISGSLMTSVLGFIFFRIQFSSDFNQKEKNQSYSILIIMLFIIIALLGGFMNKR
jgi:hypothetical protein